MSAPTDQGSVVHAPLEHLSFHDFSFETSVGECCAALETE